MRNIHDEKYQSVLIKEIKNGIDNKIPFSLVRIGDGEVGIISQKFPGIYDRLLEQFYWWLPNKEYYTEYCGAEADDLEYVEQLIESLKNADIVGYFDQSRGHNRYTNATSAILNAINFHPKNSIYAFENIYLLQNQDFINLIKEHPPLLIGKLAKPFKDILETTLDIKLPKTMHIENNKELDDLVLKLKKRKKWKWALVSAGANANIICNEIKKQGKVGIDFGSGIDMLMRHILKLEASTNLKYDFFNNINIDKIKKYSELVRMF